MTRFTIDEVAVPAAAADIAGSEFAVAIAVQSAVEAQAYGFDEFAESAEDAHASWLDPSEPKRMLLVRVDGEPAGSGRFESRIGDAASTAWLDVRVLERFRGRGIGSALSDAIEAIARDRGAEKAICYVASPERGGERLAAPTGFGSVPAANPEVRFLLARGYRLEQVERASRLALPIDAAAVEGERRGAAATAGPDYRVHEWVARTPIEWREHMAQLLTRMSTDAPTAGLEEPEDVWTVERLDERERLEQAGSRRELVAAVEHIPSGTLVAFTSLVAPADTTRAVWQEDTIVLREHRGRRLGMLVKAANLQHLARARPGHPSVVTWNAEENRHMLAVNEALGFAAFASEGAWRKDL